MYVYEKSVLVNITINFPPSLISSELIHIKFPFKG